jgi:hypothetical protein
LSRNHATSRLFWGRRKGRHVHSMFRKVLELIGIVFCCD